MNLKSKKKKKISIFDCEYYNNKNSLYNWRAMKISSFYKQQGANVVLIDTNWNITMDFDELYIIREKKNTPVPPSKIFDSNKAILMGDAFEGFEGYQNFPLRFAVCRPDYLLYPERERTPFQRAEFVQFFCGFNELKDFQNYHNAFVGIKPLIVVDYNFWDFEEDIIIKKLEDLKQTRMPVAFLYPINISKIIKSEKIVNKFYKINFYAKYPNKITNDLSSSVENAKSIIDFISNWNKSYHRFAPVQFNTITSDHSMYPEKAWEDFKRCLCIADYAKQKEVKISFRNPRSRQLSPFWAYFEFLKTWTNQFFKSSYIEAMLRNTSIKTGTLIEDILSNRLNWAGIRTRQVIYLLLAYPKTMKQFGFRTWGEEFSELKIDYDYLKTEAPMYSIEFQDIIYKEGE